MKPKGFFLEIALYAAIVVIGACLMSGFDAFERFYEYTRAHEEYELDDVSLALPLAFICLGIFSFRRMRQVVAQNKELVRARQKERELTRRIKDLSESKDRFMTTACHELNSPIATAVNALQLANMTDDPSEMRENIAVAREKLDALHLLVKDVLVFSQSVHIPEVSPAATDVRKTILSASRLLDAQAKAKGLSFEVQVDDDVPQQVVVQAGWFRVVCLNLTANAVRYTETGGVNVRCAYDADAEALILTVADTGVGIPEESLEAVFEPYRQVSGPWKRQESGLGLGLAVVKNLMDALGGTVSVTSEPQSGSTFTATFPVRSA